MATMYSVMGGTLLNLGITVSSQGNQAIAGGSFVGAGELELFFLLRKFELEVQILVSIVWRNTGVFLALVLRSMQRVKKLDKFEEMI